MCFWHHPGNFPVLWQIWSFTIFSHPENSIFPKIKSLTLFSGIKRQRLFFPIIVLLYVYVFLYHIWSFTLFCHITNFGLSDSLAANFNFNYSFLDEQQIACFAFQFQNISRHLLILKRELSEEKFNLVLFPDDKMPSEPVTSSHCGHLEMLGRMIAQKLSFFF